MKKNTAILCTLLISGFLLPAGDNVIPMKELNNPATIIVDGGQVLIAEFPVVYVYSQKDFSLITKFGKQGDGPREFSQYIRVQKDPDNPDKIVVGSHMKMSYFTRDGKFISEMRPKTAGLAVVYKPFGDQFVSYGNYQDQDTKTNYQQVILYDKDMKKIKEVYKEKNVFQQGRKINALRTWGAWFRLYGDFIFVTGEKEGVVLIYDRKGDLVRELEVDLPKLKVTDADKERYHEFFKTDPQTRNFYEQLKQQIDFPVYFPVIRGMDVADDLIYVNGYLAPDGMTEFAIYDMSWKLVKSGIRLNLPEASARDLFPYTIADGKLYQLVDNADEEVWELHIHDLK
jgi:hypothetical protein